MSIASVLLATALISVEPYTIATTRVAPHLISQSSEVSGWNDVTWGMSQAEVAAMYANAQPETRTYREELPKHFLITYGYRIGFYDYDLVFGFDNDRLTSVALKWEGEQIDSPSAEVLEALRGCYGEFDGKNSIGALEWFFPRTRVSLFEFELDGTYSIWSMASILEKLGHKAVMIDTAASQPLKISLLRESTN